MEFHVTPLKNKVKSRKTHNDVKQSNLSMIVYNKSASRKCSKNNVNHRKTNNSPLSFRQMNCQNKVLEYPFNFIEKPRNAHRPCQKRSVKSSRSPKYFQHKRLYSPRTSNQNSLYGGSKKRP